MEYLYIYGFFFLIAVLYSSVGFGGGSSYLAILAISGIAFTQLRAIALICNIVVVVGNVIQYQQKNEIHWKKVVPLVLVSIPFAFLGGFLKINQNVFFILLGFTLFFAAVTMWFSSKIKTAETIIEKEKPVSNSLIGGLIGFISGMVGIGGGIFLAPFLHLVQWDTPKKIAATASVFILFNSISGLLGQFKGNQIEVNWNFIFILLTVVFIGGQIGSRLSNRILTPLQLKKGTAILIAFVSIRILFKHLI